MNKIVLEVEMYDDKIRKKIMKAVSSISGVESVNVDMKNQQLTLTGDIDPVVVVGKLRKLCCPRIISVGPAKEEKKREPKKDEKKKPEEDKKDQNENLAGSMKVCYHIQTGQPHYYYTSIEENPNACVIL